MNVWRVKKSKQLMIVLAITVGFIAALGQRSAHATVTGTPSEALPLLPGVGSLLDVAIDPATGFFHIVAANAGAIDVRDAAGLQAGPSYNLPNSDGIAQIALQGDRSYVVGTQNKIHFFDLPTRTHLGSWGSEGSGVGQFDGIGGIETADGEVYVSDTGNLRIQVFTPNGVWLRTLTGGGTLQPPGRIAMHQGNLYLIEGLAGTIRSIDAVSGQTTGAIATDRPARGIDITSAGDIFVTTTGGPSVGDEQIDVYTTAGILQTSFSAIGARDGIAVDRTGDSLWVAAPGVGHVSVYTWSTCNGSAPTIVGTSYDDSFEVSGDTDDIVVLGPGDDHVRLGGGDDLACGEAGVDTIRGESGNDTIFGGLSPDKLVGGPGLDTIFGDSGADEILGGGGDDTLFGGDGPDTIKGQGGSDSIMGEAGGDTLDGQGAADVIDGGAGNDIINGQNGADTLLGETGKDTIKGQTGPDELHGHGDDDELFGGNGTDTLYGGLGFDKCAGNTGPDSAEAATCEQTPGVETLF